MITQTKKKHRKRTPEQISAKKHRQRMKNRAAILSIAELGPNKEGAIVYQVWGGEKPHIVRVMLNGQILCDCEGWKKARNHECSHVMKWRLVYGDLKKVSK